MAKKVQIAQISKRQSNKKEEKKRAKKAKIKAERKKRSYIDYYNAPPETFIALKPYLPQEGKSPKGGRPPISQIKVINALHYMAKVGCTWRALPEERFGPWATIYDTYRRWLAKGIFHIIFNVLTRSARLSTVMMDGTILRIHQHAAGAPHASPGPIHQDIGLSRGGLSTKLHTLVDEYGRPIKFLLTPGNINDVRMASELVKDVKNAVVLADKGYDSDKLVKQLESQGCEVVIPPRSSRKQKRAISQQKYKSRHHVENFFSKIKQFRRVATRYDKLSSTYFGFVLFASSFIWLASDKEKISKKGYLAL